MMSRLGTCKDCKHERMVGGRGLCNACHKSNKNRHTLDRFPRSTWRNEDLMAELDFFQSQGLSVSEAAERIGVSLSALRKAIERSRNREPRAVGSRST